MTTHLFAPPGDFPAALCGRNQPWASQDGAVYGRDFHRVTCAACLAKLEMPPYTEQDAARLRRGVFWGVWFAVPIWVVLIIAVWRLLT